MILRLKKNKAFLFLSVAFFINFYLLCVCRCTHTTKHVWTSENSLWKSALSLHPPRGSQGVNSDLRACGRCPEPSEQSQWPLAAVYFLDGTWLWLVSADAWLPCLYRILPRNIRSSLQEAACDWTASWLSAKTDYPLCIIRRCRLTQWSRHQGCMQGERKMTTYHYGDQLLISECSLGAPASLWQAKTSAS